MKYSIKYTSETLGPYLSKYISDGCSLQDIVQKLCKEIKGLLEQQDYAVMLVKESVPILVLALVDYACFYFTDNDDRTALESSLFYLLSLLCKDNNFCKAQVFKGDGLRHLRCLINS